MKRTGKPVADRRGGWMQTAHGRQFWPLDPHPDDVHLDDIAHHLSHLCRFGGACKTLYTVADHCVRVAELARAAGADTMLIRAALLHDASEAYVGDVVRPIKSDLTNYTDIEARVMTAIERRFNLPLGHLEHAFIKHWDNVMLATEKRDLMVEPPAPWVELPAPHGDTIVPVTSATARQLFLNAAAELGLA